MRLKAQGRHNFVILEAADGVGGTWWVNRYPGCACDVPSHLYSLSYQANPFWPERYASRADIQAHLANAVNEHGLTPHLRLNCAVKGCRWDGESKRWLITDAERVEWRARFLILATGGLSRPAYPDIPGLPSFAGPVIHSQQWPEQLDLHDKRVAVIGTGASAIQFVPKVAEAAKQLTVYQRSAPWILPRRNRPIPRWRQSLYARFSPLRLLTRLAIFIELESRLPAFVRWPALTALHQTLAKRHLRRQVKSPTLRAQLAPDYAMGCKRVLRSDDYYPCFNLPHVTLNTDGIARIVQDGVIDGAGRHRAADLLLLGTGFQATRPFPVGFVQGLNGRDLASTWADGPQAYKGSAIAGFPNLFLLMGPNTALGHNSVLLMLEAQIQYLLSALSLADRHDWQTVEVRASAQQAWNDDLQRRLQRSQWNQGGCSSWYLHPTSGRNTTLWPRSTLTFKRQLRRFDPDAYHLSTAVM